MPPDRDAKLRGTPEHRLDLVDPALKEPLAAPAPASLLVRVGEHRPQRIAASEAIPMSFERLQLHA